MTLRKSAPHQKPRWLALLVVVTLALGLVATTALANHVTVADAPAFSFVNDQDGADDEPGQKDLNSHASATDADGFWAAFKWDITRLTGKNTGDGCFLFDTDTPSNGLVDAAVCVVIDGNPAAFDSFVIYTCGDGREDRCTNPDVVEPAGSAYITECFVTNPVSDPFHGATAEDTQATCLIDLDEINADVTPTLINTCSYPSGEPNSDPSDCIVTIASSITTTPSGSTTWTATLHDSATVTPSNATGTVTFRLYSDAGCQNLVWTSAPVAVVGGAASTVGSGAGSPEGANVRTNETTPGAGSYYWIATYTPTEGTAFTGSASACGEQINVTAATAAVPAP